MTNSKDLVRFYYDKIVKSLNHLEYSFNKARKLRTDPKELSESELEAWDGFGARFSRSSDIFLSKFIKAYIKADDPAFDGSFRDFLNRAEKLNLIDGIEDWIEIRAMRNVVVHEYSEDDLEAFFIKLVRYTPLLISLREKLADAN